AHLGGRSRLGVPGVNLAWAADEKKQYAVDGAILHRPGCLLSQKTRQRQAKRRNSPGVQELAAGHAVTQGNRTFGIKAQHRKPLRAFGKKGDWTSKPRCKTR